MMRWDGFGRSVLFAAVAALGTGVWIVLTAGAIGGSRALAVWLVALTAAYVAGLTADLRRGVAASVATFAAGCGLLIVAPGLRELAVGLALVLAIARSVFLHRRRPARAVVVEAVLVVGGLLFAAHAGGPSLRGVVAGVWAFLLVQSCFFLVPGGRERSFADAAPDPFDAAHGRALALLDGEP